MAMRNPFFDRLRPRRSVLLRTRAREGLPKAALYLEWLPHSAQRKVLDEKGDEHLIDDRVLESHYKLAGGGKGKKLIEAHWSSEKAVAGTPYVAQRPLEEAKAAAAPKAKVAKERARPAEKTPKKAGEKTTKKASKKASKKATKKAAKKTAKKASKKASKKATKKPSKKSTKKSKKKAR